MVFDALDNETQIVEYVNSKGEDVIIKVEPIFENNMGGISPMLSPGGSHRLPYGTTTGYKISANNPFIGWSYKVNVNVPTNTANSKFTRAYDANYHIILGSLSDTKFTRSNKTVTYSADVSWLGGLGGANAYLKTHLSGNLITVSARM